MPRNSDPVTYDTTGKHFRVHPTSNPKYYVVWLYQSDQGPGYELHAGTWLDCCRVMAENADKLK